MSRLRQERGFTTPVELLLASAVFIVVLGATLETFARGQNNSANTERLNVSQDAARTALDRMTRELRNIAAPGSQTGLERAAATDVVFQSVDPAGPSGGANVSSVRRVRYCLGNSVATPTRPELWRQVQNWTTAVAPALPAATACPSVSFGSQTVLLDYVSNGARAVFTYDSGTLTSIGRIKVDLFVDRDATKPPGEAQLSTGVFLRNKARPPTAAFTATAQGSKHVFLNGSSSVEPDGQTLEFHWYDGATEIGQDPLMDWVAPTTGVHSLSLKVIDPSGLSNTAPVQAVNVL